MESQIMNRKVKINSCVHGREGENIAAIRNRGALVKARLHSEQIFRGGGVESMHANLSKKSLQKIIVIEKVLNPNHESNSLNLPKIHVKK